MWLELMQQLSANFRINPPATEQQLRSTELTLDIQLSADLQALLSETNGVDFVRVFNGIEFQESVIHDWSKINWWDPRIPVEHQPANMSKFLLIGGGFSIDFAYEMNSAGQFLPYIVLCDSDEYTEPRVVSQNLREYLEAVASGRDNF